ncbi:hypothetical protein SE17_28820, partial [Kouleothrix aurantiaca]
MPGHTEQKNSPAAAPASAPFTSNTTYGAAGHQWISATHSQNGSAASTKRTGQASAQKRAHHAAKPPSFGAPRTANHASHRPIVAPQQRAHTPIGKPITMYDFAGVG